MTSRHIHSCSVWVGCSHQMVDLVKVFLISMKLRENGKDVVTPVWVSKPDLPFAFVLSWKNPRQALAKHFTGGLTGTLSLTLGEWLAAFPWESPWGKLRVSQGLQVSDHMLPLPRPFQFILVTQSNY